MSLLVKKNKYNPIEKAIMKLLYQIRVPMSSYYVAQKLKISTITAQKYLRSLRRGNVIKSRTINKGAGKKKSTTVYGFNYRILKSK